MSMTSTPPYSVLVIEGSSLFRMAVLNMAHRLKSELFLFEEIKTALTAIREQQPECIFVSRRALQEASEQERLTFASLATSLAARVTVTVTRHEPRDLGLAPFFYVQWFLTVPFGSDVFVRIAGNRAPQDLGATPPGTEPLLDVDPRSYRGQLIEMMPQVEIAELAPNPIRKLASRLKSLSNLTSPEPLRFEPEFIRQHKLMNADVEMLDHFGVLGIDKKARKTEIQRAYLSVVSHFHPDLAGIAADKRLLQEMILVFRRATQAWQVLRNRLESTRYRVVGSVSSGVTQI